SFIDIIFLLNNLPFSFKLILYIVSWSTVLGSMYAYPLFSIPIMASLVHEAAGTEKILNIDEAMAKLSGSYYGLESFARSMGPATASLLVGIILSEPNDKNPIVILFLFVSIGVFYLIAFIFVKGIKLSKINSNFNR
ncbi:MAG: hypothetical protein ACFE96_18270, partial [Candidatus Hermodarchaeota archaeon]